MGNTNIVARPSKNAAELSKAESAAGTPILEEKIRAFRPEAVCIVGKGIWESIWRWRYKRNIRKDEFKYGWQDDTQRLGKDDDWAGAAIFVATATSGLAANMKPHEKEAIWLPFGQWVKQRREERQAAFGEFLLELGDQRVVLARQFLHPRGFLLGEGACGSMKLVKLPLEVVGDVRRRNRRDEGEALGLRQLGRGCQTHTTGRRLP